MTLRRVRLLSSAANAASLKSLLNRLLTQLRRRAVLRGLLPTDWSALRTVATGGNCPAACDFVAAAKFGADGLCWGLGGDLDVKLGVCSWRRTVEPVVLRCSISGS